MKTTNIFGHGIIKRVPMFMAAALFMSGFFIANFALAVDDPCVDDATCVTTAQTALETATTLNPAEGTDTNVVTMAQSIVDTATATTTGVTVSLGSSLNARVAEDGIITYSTATTGDVSFHLVKGAESDDQIMSVIVPPAAPNYTTIFGSIVTALGGNGITTNLATLCSSTPTACSGLYFEKTGYGRVTFTTSLDLTDSNVVPFLQSLESKMIVSAGSMKFDARTAAALKEAGAEIKLYKLDALGFTSTPNIIVKDDSGNIISISDTTNYPTLTGVTYSGGTLTFTTSHFTEFEVDNNVYVDVTNTGSEDGTQAKPYNTIQEGIDAVEVDGTVNVAAGTYEITTGITANKSTTIQGPVTGTATVEATATAAIPVFTIVKSTANVTIKNLEITMSQATLDSYAAYDGLISVQDDCTGISISGNTIWAPSQGTPDTMGTWWARGIKMEHRIGATIDGNTVYNLRTGMVAAYGSVVTYSNNVIYNTKGGIMNYTNALANDVDYTITNNSWTAPDPTLSHNEWDIVWNSEGSYLPSAVPDYAHVVSDSKANDGAYVIDQRTDTTPGGLGYAIEGNKSHCFVEAGSGNDIAAKNNGHPLAPYSNIGLCIDGVAAGGTVIVADGNYSETLNLSGKKLSLIGDSTSAIVDASSLTGYAVQNFGDYTTIKNLKLIGSSNNYGFKVSGANNITLENIVVENSYHTAIDLNGVNTATLKDIVITGTQTKGFGLMIGDSNDVTVNNINTSSATTPWGGVTVQTKGEYYTGGSDNVQFTGIFNSDLMIEQDPYNSVYSDITNLALPSQYEYAVYTERDPSGDAYKQEFYYETLDEAKTAATSFTESTSHDYEDIIIYDIEGTNSYVIEGLSIQTAIDAASSGDTINVAAGTYNESILIGTPLTLVGEDGTIITGDDSSYNYIAKVVADDVIINNVEIDGGGSAVGNNAFDYGVWLTNTDSVELLNLDVKNIWKSASNGIQVDDSTNSNIHANTISSFHKRGIRYINSTTGTFYGNEVIGDNVNGNDRVQNLVNVNDGSSVKIYDNDLHNALTNSEDTPTWSSPAIIVSSYSWAGSEADSYANIYDNEIYNSDIGIIIGSTYSASDGSTADITGNNIHNTENAINFEVDRTNSGLNTVSAVIHQNIFIDNDMVIDTYDTANTTTEINAENNWWGTAASSTIAGLISGDVDYSPWWTTSVGPSSAPADFAAGSATTNSIALNWINNASDGNYYIIKRSTSAITNDTEFDAATTLGGAPTPIDGSQGYVAKNLDSGTTYHFAIKLVDSNGSASALATVSDTTLAAAAVSTDTIAPGAITDLALQAGSPATSKITLSWSATGDDDATGFASKYIIKRSTSEITAENFDAATTIFNSLTPKPVGSTESFTAIGLTAGTTYYFAIKVQDEVPNTSLISNVANLATLNNLPTVSGIDKSEGDNDGAVPITVTGTNFIDGDNTLRFSNSSNTFEIAGTYVSATSLRASVPVGAPVGGYNLKVSNSNGTSVALTSAYEVVIASTPLPTVSDLIPANIGSNDSNVSLTIYGNNFTGATAVTIDTAPETALTINLASSTETKIVATVTGTVSAGTYNIKVTTAGGTNTISSVKLNVKAPITITASSVEQTTDKPIDLSATSTIPVQITMQSDETIVNTETNATIEVVIPPATEVKDADGNAYTGNINPPQIVKTTDEMREEAGEDSIVITMGNPNEKITFSNDFVTTVTLESTNTKAPLIWYYNPATGLEIAGKDGVKDGVDYVPGGTVLNTINDNGVYTYTIGLLLDHMSSYVAGVNPSITSLSSSSATAGTSIIITGTNFSTGATVKFGTTAATVSSLTTTSISVTVPSVSVGSHNIVVTNTDGLFSGSKTFNVTAAPAPAPVSSGGGGGSYALAEKTNDIGDINGNSRVDKYDFALMMSVWGRTGSGLAADLNSDAKVDKYDFALLMLNWAK